MNQKPYVWIPAQIKSHECLLGRMKIYFTLVTDEEVIAQPEKGPLIKAAFFARSFNLFEQIEKGLLPNLKYVTLRNNGYERIPLDLFKKHGIQLANVRSPTAVSVSELCFAHMLSLSRNIHKHFVDAQNGKWEKLEGVLLSQSVLGIVGMGNIGYAIAKKAKAFDMSIAYHNRSRNLHLEENVQADFYKDLHEMLNISDFVVITCPLNEASFQSIGSDEFKQMKKTSYFINMARGKIVVTDALVEAIEKGTIAGAALDVIEPEPLPQDHPLRSFDNVIMTPHIGHMTSQSEAAILDEYIENIVQVLVHGNPLPNRVV